MQGGMNIFILNLRTKMIWQLILWNGCAKGTNLHNSRASTFKMKDYTQNHCKHQYKKQKMSPKYRKESTAIQLNNTKHFWLTSQLPVFCPSLCQFPFGHSQGHDDLQCCQSVVRWWDPRKRFVRSKCPQPIPSHLDENLKSTLKEKFRTSPNKCWQ